jgi:hypothetical protein
MLAFKDNKDGYYQFADDAPASWYAQLTPCDLQSPPPPTPEQLLKAIEQAIEKHMDEVAQADGWDNRWSCMARAGYVNPWQAKAIKYAQWVDECWGDSFQAQADIEAGLRAIPTPEEAVLELPLMEWPV